MAVKSLCDLGFEAAFGLTMKFAKEIQHNQDVWLNIYETWSYISILHPTTNDLYYKMLNKYCHMLSHDCKSSHHEIRDFPTLLADEVFILLITCQSPKLIFDYKMRRQRMIPENVIPSVEFPSLSRYFETSVIELDLSGADFCCEDALLIVLLPKCKSLRVLCLGNAGSEDVLNAAKLCPLWKLQLEERFPLHPKLPQHTVLKYLLGYSGTENALDQLLEICKSQMLIESALIEETEATRMERSKYLNDFLSSCRPWWPEMKILILGNCRICREALILCLLVLRSLEQISIHRIQSDELLNTCARVFNSFDLKSTISIKSLNLWAGWSGFGNNALNIAPYVDSLCLIAYGYPNLNLQEAVEKNQSLEKIINLGLVGLRYAGTNIFKESNPFLSRIVKLEMSGVNLTTEELVNVLTCLPKLSKLDLDYSELRNYTYQLTNKKYPRHSCLTHFSVETSFIDKEFLESLFIMAENIEHLCIRGKTRNFKLSFTHQDIFLHSPKLKIKYLELYPRFMLDMAGLVQLSKTKTTPEQKFQLCIDLATITQYEYFLLTQNGWYITPVCSRC